ncbi:MAG TPA: extracellular solute-binding protein, partial [Anaerolineae bacterium]
WPRQVSDVAQQGYRFWAMASLAVAGWMVYAALQPNQTSIGFFPDRRPVVTAAPTVSPAVSGPRQAPTLAAVTEAPVATEAPLAGTVTFWHIRTGVDAVNLDAIVSAFERKYPNVRVEVNSMQYDEMRSQLEVTAAAGEGPTVVLGFTDWAPELFDTGLIADLTSELDGATLNRIMPEALAVLRYKGALIGLPYSMSGVVLYRNKAIIPRAPATFEELAALAKAATKGGVDGAHLEYGVFFAAAHLNGIGGALMDDQGNPTFNTEAGVAWLDLLKSFKEIGPVEYYTDEDLNQFEQDRAGFIIDGTWNLARLANAIGAPNLSIDPWPKPLSGYVTVDSLFLNANARRDDREASIEFIKFLLSPEAQARLTDLTNSTYLPVLEDVTVDDPLVAQALLSLHTTGTMFPHNTAMNDYWGPLEEALRTGVDENGDSATALQDAYEQVARARGVSLVAASPAPKPTAAPTLSSWRIVLSDAFSTDSHRWLVGEYNDDYVKGSRSISAGKYRWDYQAKQGVTWYVEADTESMSSLYLTVDAQQVGGSASSEYGLVFRANTAGYYLFSIQSDLFYGFSRWSQNQWTTLIPGATSTAIEPGKVNQLRVIAEGSHFTFFINGQYVAEADDDQLPSGNVGVATGISYDGQSAVFEFDNFEVRAP